jgi:ribulose-5-phosphate 4-epimerase/fuculose-1-phosphate aldolase
MVSQIETPRLLVGDDVPGIKKANRPQGPHIKQLQGFGRIGTTEKGVVMDENKARDEICRFGLSLFQRGLTPGSSGNISLRLDDGGWLVTPTNASLGFLDPARISRLDPNGRLLAGDPPTKEIPLHEAFYDCRTSARAIVHLHSTNAVALSMLSEVDPRAVLPPMTAYYVMRVGQTALAPYYRPGDPAVADAIRGLAGRYSSVLLANHGPVVAGDSLEAAVFATEELEETAKLYLLLRGMNPRFLSPAQVADLVATFKLNLPLNDEGCRGN